VPEQQVDVNNSSSNDHTTWGYNPDGTIQTVTDARGAVATYTYNNNRRLVNLITYSAPAGITPTANVSLEYDAAGNRKSMTDGSGSQSYNYNQLSQLTSETRTFGVGSYTLSYDYNLAGELKKITDPTNSTINYGLDSAGRLNSVTGSDNLFAGVSTYAANFQYRAFDAVKSLTYGNSKTLAVGYDNRLAVSSYEVPGILKKSYQRNDDNSLQFTQDQVIANSKFDRSYTYDHLGRVTTALSGAEARGQSASDDRPYHETFGYDAMNHLTTRAARQWNRDIGSGTDAFVNNRNPSWSYDADGRLTFGSTGAYVYDAAGSTVSFGDASPNMTDQQFDGDGQRVKSTQRRYDDPTDQWVTDSVTYYLNSTVLGGQVVTELTAQGTKQRTYVYAGQTVLAWQSVAANGSQSVAWEHRDASGASFRMTDASGTFTGQSGELDPVGANAGLFKPLTWPPPRSTGQLISFRGFEDMDLAGGGCELDRVPVPCGMVTQGNSVACPNNDCSRYNPNLRNGHGGMEDFHAYADGRAFYLAAGWTWTGNQFHGPGAMTVSFIDNHVPADLGKEYNHLLPQNPAPNVNDLESRITKMVSNPDCAKFISDLINGTATAKNPAEFTDALIGFGKIKSFIYGDTIMKAYGFAGGTVHGSISGGDAQVELPTPGRFPVGLSRRGAAEYISDQGRINAETVLHEILHLAGKNVYDDFAYAKTVADMRGVKRLDYTGMAYRDAVRKASEYWNDALMGACGPKGPRYEQH
jgi:YD repeat-containing protein